MDTHDPSSATGQGSPAALTPDQVFRDYAPRVYNLARRMLGNDADAEDVTQDVLLQVVRKLHTFRGESQLPTWLHRVTVNAALAHREKRANRLKRETSTGNEEALEAAAMDAEDSAPAGVRLPPPEQVEAIKTHLCGCRGCTDRHVEYTFTILMSRTLSKCDPLPPEIEARLRQAVAAGAGEG